MLSSTTVPIFLNKRARESPSPPHFFHTTPHSCWLSTIPIGHNHPTCCSQISSYNPSIDCRYWYMTMPEKLSIPPEESAFYGYDIDTLLTRKVSFQPLDHYVHIPFSIWQTSNQLLLALVGGTVRCCDANCFFYTTGCFPYTAFLHSTFRSWVCSWISQRTFTLFHLFELFSITDYFSSHSFRCYIETCATQDRKSR